MAYTTYKYEKVESPICDSLKVYYEFDSGEEALLEIITRRRGILLGNKTISDINKIKKRISICGVNIITYFIWREYVFFNMGRLYSYIGKMKKSKLSNIIEGEIMLEKLKKIIEYGKN